MHRINVNITTVYCASCMLLHSIYMNSNIIMLPIGACAKGYSSWSVCSIETSFQVRSHCSAYRKYITNTRFLICGFC